jgi:nucleoside-diphosphate-sugar epimerase
MLEIYGWINARLDGSGPAKTYYPVSLKESPPMPTDTTPATLPPRPGEPGLRVLVLGAGGFLGARLADRLAADGHLGGAPIGELVLVDARPLPAPSPAAPAAPPACAVTRRCGDIRSAALLDALFSQPVQVVFHLAATLTVDAEADLQLGLDTNVLAFIDLLAHCRRQAAQAPRLVPRLVFASSIATYGGALPDTVGDDTPQAPATSYGCHKAIAELLLQDHSRRGLLDGRALRLPIVVTHPGPASGSISDQVSALIREPLRGQATVCRMAPDSRLVVATVEQVVDAFVRLAALPVEAMAAGCTMNLPGLSVTPAALVQAVDRHLPANTPARVAWRPDPAVQAIVDGWPRAFDSVRARQLGFTAAADADALVSACLATERLTP